MLILLQKKLFKLKEIKMGASKDFKQIDVQKAYGKPRYNNNRGNNNHKKGNFKKKSTGPIKNYDYKNSRRGEGEFNRKRIDIFIYQKRAQDGKFVFKVFKYKKFENWGDISAKRYFPAYISLHNYKNEIYMFNCNRKLTDDNIQEAVKVKTIYEYDDGNIFIITYDGFGYTAEPFLSPKQMKRYYGL